MARSPRWTSKHLNKGVYEYTLSSWTYFSDFINQEMLDYTTYVYRGHGNSNWKLEPTLDRIIRLPTSSKRANHLQKFKFETRGRRGSNPIRMDDDNDWWALGQHHGLATPLLDWTESPFVGLYFAANEAKSQKTEYLTVYAISQAYINKCNIKIKGDDSIPLTNGRKPTVKIVRPFSDENKRLVSQRGLFTRGPNNVDLEKWVQTYASEDTKTISLIKINIPNKNTEQCLRYLNRMNINHSTLFPDLPGASEFCNIHLTIDRY